MIRPSNDAGFDCLSKHPKYMVYNFNIDMEDLWNDQQIHVKVFHHFTNFILLFLSLKDLI